MNGQVATEDRIRILISNAIQMFAFTWSRCLHALSARCSVIANNSRNVHAFARFVYEQHGLFL